MKLLAYLLIFSLLALIQSCGGGGGGGSDAPAQEEGGTTGGTSGGSSSGTNGGSSGADLIYDSEISLKEKEGLDKSTTAMGNYVIDGNQIKRFSQIFGGGRSSNVVHFFETRVKYALSAATDLDSRLVVSFMEPGEAQTLASNRGIELWYEAKAISPSTLRFNINGELHSVPSSRVGVIQVGDPFADLETILQVETLVHEARHSDCTGGIYASDIERYKGGQSPLNNSCGHLHVICPPGHSYAGLAACDGEGEYWGAYVVGAIYAAAVAYTCDSCSVSEKIMAQQIYIDSRSRTLYDFNDLINGDFGPPDMSNSTQVR